MANQKKILWVEDEKDLIDVYTEIIKAVGGVDVEFMQLGQQVIDRIKEIQDGKAEKPDLIMLDLLLPDINGDKVCEVIRNTPATKGIRVFVLTNYSGEQMQEKMTKELEAEKYLVKTEWIGTKLIPLIQEAIK
ncbi:MAG: response regulator [Candidatus Staskawiczbacteria bacterium]|nr:response regulator [Candidatus Staskawiczbacteria bacterium]